MSAGPNVGDRAPDFSLRDQNNEVVTLSEYRAEKAVLIVFYPLAFTGTCSGELGAVQLGLTSFVNDRVQIVSISVDSVPAHKVFADQNGFEFPLLADFWPHGAVARSYGVFDDLHGIAGRGTFLVDVDGVVRWVQRHRPGDARNPRDWLVAIDEL